MTSTKPRIAFVIPSLSLGGAERSLVKLANGLTRTSFEVHLVIFGRPEATLENELDRTIGTVFLGGDSSWSPRLWLQLVRTLRRIRPDLVFGWSLFANLAVTWLQPFHGCRRVIVSERNYLPLMTRELPWWRWRLLQTLIRRCYRRARYVTANSAPSVEAVQAWVGPGPDYVVIPNMIQVDAARASAALPAPGMPARQAAEGRGTDDQGAAGQGTDGQGRLCILALGRLVFQKGFDVLLSAFAEVRKLRDWDLAIVGQGELEAPLKQQAAALGLSDRVHWLGRQPVPFPYYQAADLVVVPSRFEGIPNVLLEAMALGRPTIAADCMTGPRILTENGRFGVLVPVEDAAALAAAIVELGDDAERRAELGRQAGEHIAQTYDEPIVLADITALLRTAPAVRLIGALPARLRHALSWTILANLGIGLINLGTQIWLARTLGIAIIGDYGTVIIFLQLVFLATSYGFNQAVIQSGYTVERMRVVVALVYGQIAAMGLILALALTVAAWLAPALVERLLWPGLFAALGMAVLHLGNVQVTKLMCELDYKRIALVQLAASLCALVAAVGIGTIRHDIYAPIGRDLVQAVAFFGFAWYGNRLPLKPLLERTKVRQIVRFSLSTWLLTVLEVGTMRLDYALVGLVLGRESFGIYFQARALVEGVLVFLIKPVKSVLFSHWSSVRDRPARFIRSIDAGTVLAVALGVLAFALGSLIGPALVGFVLGPDWQVGGALLGGLGVYAVASFYFENLAAIAKSRAIHHWAVLGRLAQALVLLALVVPLTQALGFWGAGLATGVSALALASVAAYLVRRSLRQRSTLEFG